MKKPKLFKNLYLFVCIYGWLQVILVQFEFVFSSFSKVEDVKYDKKLFFSICGF